MIKNLLKLFLENLALWISTSQTTIRDFLDRRGCCILSRLEALLADFMWTFIYIAAIFIGTVIITCFKVDSLFQWVARRYPTLLYKKWFVSSYYFFYNYGFRLMLSLYLITLIIILIVIYSLFFLNTLAYAPVLSWFSADTFISIYPLIIQAPHKKFFSTVSDKRPWLIYRDPFKSKTLDPVSIKKFISKFLDDIISNCPSDQHIEFSFKDKFSTANASIPLILHYWLDNDDKISEIELPKFMKVAYSNIENITKDDVLLYRNETLNILLTDINYNISHDKTHSNIILDFASMFILYRYYPVRKSISPLIWKDFSSKRHYSTTVNNKQPWLKYEDPLNSIDLNRITVETFLFNFFREIISNYPNGQFISWILYLSPIYSLL